MAGATNTSVTHAHSHSSEPFQWFWLHQAEGGTTTTVYWVLKVGTIIASIVMVTLLTVLFILLYKNRQTIALLTNNEAEGDNEQKKQASKSRKCKKRMHACFYKFCCCCRNCPGCKQIYDNFGFEALSPGAKSVLRVTLICASDYQGRGAFYLEVNSVPLEGAPKHSRTHHPATPKNFSFGSESLDIDWYGDEEEVVIQMMQWDGSKGDFAGELRLERDQIEKYAKESQGKKSDIKAGSRRFNVRKLEDFEKKQRKKGQKTVTARDKFILQMVQDQLGMPHDDNAAHNVTLRLQEENRSLKTQLASAHLQATASTDPLSKEAAKHPMMKLVMRFEILPIDRTVVSFEEFRSTSFVEESRNG